MHSANALPDVEGSVTTYESPPGDVIRASWRPLSVPTGSSGRQEALEPPGREPGGEQIWSCKPSPAPTKGFLKPFGPGQKP